MVHPREERAADPREERATMDRIPLMDPTAATHILAVERQARDPRHQLREERATMDIPLMDHTEAT